jgi:hypothetical protein
MAENETLIQLPALSRAAVEVLVRMWGIALAALNRNTKIVAAATVELAVFGSAQQKIAGVTGAPHPFEEIEDILHPYLKEMLADVKREIIQSGKDPDEILREGRKRFNLLDTPFEEDGEPDFS